MPKISSFDKKCEYLNLLVSIYLLFNYLILFLFYSINKGYRRIVFARTALEIKSSVGANPKVLYGLMRHNNRFINFFVPKLFHYFEPKMEWKERNPFK